MILTGRLSSISMRDFRTLKENPTIHYPRGPSSNRNHIHCQTLGRAKYHCCRYYTYYFRRCCQMTCVPSSWRGYSGWLRRSVYQRVLWYISFKNSTLFDDSCCECISSLKDCHQREIVIRNREVAGFLLKVEQAS